jgi:hypothetical protein
MAIEVYKILHQESPSYLHDLIKIKDICVLKWFGNSFHSLAAAYRKDFRPYLVVRTEGISVMLSYLKQYLVSLILIKSCKYEGLS